MEHPFETVLLCLGALLLVGALLSGLAKRSFLSMAALFTISGLVLGESGFQILEFQAHSKFVEYLAVSSLIIILFRDGLEIEGNRLKEQWKMPARKLIIAMPLTMILIAVFAHFVLELGWTASFLIGALLAPTDPILTSGIISNNKISKKIRHSLNLESGLNDGLALPAVLAFSASLMVQQGDQFVWWQFIIQDVALGVIYGLVIGVIAAKILGLVKTMDRHQKSLFGFGVAFITYGIALLGPHGNGFIAVFVAAITLGILRDDVREAVEEQSQDIVELVELAVFVVFGALISYASISAIGIVPLVAFAFLVFVVARPVSIVVALIGSPEADMKTKLFMGWFGPKGIATMAFSLLLLSKEIPGAEKFFAICAAVVFMSIIVHSTTDYFGAKWAEKHLK